MFSSLNKIFLLISILIIISCKKEKDGLKPIITLSSPIENQKFEVFESIPVIGTVEDDSKIELIKISLVDEEQKPVAPAITITPGENKTSFNKGILLDDIQMKSGNYFVVITASDGINEKKLFQKVFILEAPRKRIGVFVITSNGISTKAELIDSTNQVNFYTSFSGDYSGSSVSSYYQTLTVAGYKTGDLNCVSLKDKSFKWKVPTTSQAYPTFTDLEYFDKLNYTSFYNGLIKAYDNNSAISMSFSSYSGFYSKRIITIDNHLVSFQESFSNSNKRLVTYNKNTGFLYHNLSIDYEVIDFCQKSQKEIFVFGNSGNNGLLRIYYSEENGQWEPLAMPAGKISSAIKLNETTYMFANNNGLYTYQYMPNGTFLFKAGNFSKVIYDELNNLIIAVENNQVNYYDYSTRNLISSFSFSEDIKNIHLWYNK